MQSIQIQWRETAANGLQGEKYAHFLAVVRGNSIQSITQAYRKTISEAFAHLELHPGERVFVGRINPFGVRSISPEVVDSLFSLLLTGCKPQRNLEGKYRYHGLASIQLSNVGLAGLPAHLRAEDGRVFLRSQPKVPLMAFQHA